MFLFGGHGLEMLEISKLLVEDKNNYKKKYGR